MHLVNMLLTIINTLLIAQSRWVNALNSHAHSATRANPERSGKPDFAFIGA